MKKVEAIQAIHISADVKENDRVDIKCGGPQYLGFDFYINPDDKKKALSVVKEEIDKRDFPMSRVYECGTVLIEEKNVWTIEKIIKCIREYKP